MKLLISSGEWNAAMACVESLGKAGHLVDVLASGDFVPAAQSRWRSSAIRTPSEYLSPDYERRLIDVLKTGGYDLFVPISERAIDVAVKLRDRIEQHCNMILPDAAAIRIAQDKTETQRLAEHLGVPTPRSLYPATMEDFPTAVAELGLPCVAKLPRSTGSLGVLVAETLDEVLEFVSKRGRKDNWPFLQAYEPGDTADVAVVCSHGKVVRSHAFYVEARHMIGGTPPFARAIAEPAALEHHVDLIARALDWHGPLDFDYTLNAAGEYLLLELNPRFSGTITFALAARVDLPIALVDVAEGRSPQRVHSLESVSQFRTGLEYELQWWLQSPLRRLPEWIAKRLDSRVRAISRWNQPKVLLAQAVSAVRTLRNRRRKAIAIKKQRM